MTTKPLDLSRLDPAVWHLLSGGRVFGPYTLGQLQEFANAGRIGIATRLAHGLDGPFRPIGDIPDAISVLAPVFRARAARLADGRNYLVTARAPLPVEASLWKRIGEILAGLGAASELMPGTWIVRSRTNLAGLRQAISEIIPASVQVIIVEAGPAARAGTLGLGADADKVAREVWEAALPPPS